MQVSIACTEPSLRSRSAEERLGGGAGVAAAPPPCSGFGGGAERGGSRGGGARGGAAAPAVAPRRDPPGCAPGPGMKYRNLGRSGLRVSCLGLGARGTFGAGISEEEAERVLSAAYESGVTLFDLAEATGRAEQTLGKILRSKGWRRSSYVITTRVFWGGHADRGLSRKHVLEGLRGTLQRLQLDYVDVAFAWPRPGPPPLKGSTRPCDSCGWKPSVGLRVNAPPVPAELVRAMSDVIERGLALYWGTAGGAPGDVMDAYAVARQLNLVAPVCQWAELPPEPRLFRQLGLGAVTWSPVAPGPPLDEEPPPPGRPPAKGAGGRPLLKVGELQPLAQRLGCSVPQLVIAWSLRAEGVSSVLVGAGTPRLLQEQLRALQVLPQLSPRTLQELETLLGEAAPP